MGRTQDVAESRYADAGDNFLHYVNIRHVYGTRANQDSTTNYFLIFFLHPLEQIPIPKKCSNDQNNDVRELANAQNT